MTAQASSPLEVLADWGADVAAGVVVAHGSAVAVAGPTTTPVAVASLTKLATARAVLVAVEEGATTIDTPLGPAGSTVGHVLAHASGLDVDTDAVRCAPGTRRIYSNAGYELLGAHVEASTGIAFVDYLTEAVLIPLGMASTELRGSAAAGLWSTADNLARLLVEYRSPRLVDRTTASDAASCRFPGLAGVLPGWGEFDPCDWGWGPELRGTKSPHWTGADAAPSTLGHFGRNGSFLWFDPTVDVGCVIVTDREFGGWAASAWPPLSTAIRERYSTGSGSDSDSGSGSSDVVG